MDKFDGDARRSYSVSTFSGSDVSNVRFLSGAYRGSSNDSQGHQFDFVGATEFRDSYYAAAPQNSLLDQVEDFDFADDKFFDTEQELRLDLSAYPCDAAADVEVQVEMRSEFMQEVRKNCEPSDFRNMHFCHESTEIRSAEMNFGPYCVDSGPGPS